MKKKEEVYAKRMDHSKKEREEVSKEAIEEHQEAHPETKNPETIHYKLERPENKK